MAALVLTSTDDIYKLLLKIADAPSNSDLKVELEKTAAGATAAFIGGGIGGFVGAIVAGPFGAVGGATLGAGAAMCGVPNFKPLPVLLRGASQEDRQKIAVAASSAAISLSIRLTWGLVVPYVTPDARNLLLEVLRGLGYKVSS